MTWDVDHREVAQAKFADTFEYLHHRCPSPVRPLCFHRLRSGEVIGEECESDPGELLSIASRIDVNSMACTLNDSGKRGHSKLCQRFAYIILVHNVLRCLECSNQMVPYTFSIG